MPQQRCAGGLKLTLLLGRGVWSSSLALTARTACSPVTLWSFMVMKGTTECPCSRSSSCTQSTRTLRQPGSANEREALGAMASAPRTRAGSSAPPSAASVSSLTQRPEEGSMRVPRAAHMFSWYRPHAPSASSARWYVKYSVHCVELLSRRKVALASGSRPGSAATGTRATSSASISSSARTLRICGVQPITCALCSSLGTRRPSLSSQREKLKAFAVIRKCLCPYHPDSRSRQVRILPLGSRKALEKALPCGL
mmetsp:Transcript_22178/g.56197  ORF Transcript_22178/g.56197 Transcript_22178/m.56197 type:complete len:254 (-) Transcript_22178:625-1386(-)